MTANKRGSQFWVEEVDIVSSPSSCPPLPGTPPVIVCGLGSGALGHHGSGGGPHSPVF